MGRALIGPAGKLGQQNAFAFLIRAGTQRTQPVGSGHSRFLQLPPSALSRFRIVPSTELPLNCHPFSKLLTNKLLVEQELGAPLIGAEIPIKHYASTYIGRRVVVGAVRTRASPGRSRLALFDYVPGDGWQDGAPGDAAITPVFLPALCAELTVEDRDLLCFKLIQATAESATLQFAADGFGRRFFSTFAPVLDRSHSICYRPANRVAEFAPGYPSIDPVVFDFLSEHAGAIDRVICADIDTLRDDRRRLGLAAEKWELA